MEVSLQSKKQNKAGHVTFDINCNPFKLHFNQSASICCHSPWLLFSPKGMETISAEQTRLYFVFCYLIMHPYTSAVRQACAHYISIYKDIIIEDINYFAYDLEHPSFLYGKLFGMNTFNR